MPDILISNGYLILFQKVSVQMELSLSRGFIKLHITADCENTIFFVFKNIKHLVKFDITEF